MTLLRWLLVGSAALLAAGWVAFSILANNVFSAIMFVEIYQSIFAYKLSNVTCNGDRHIRLGPGVL
jgi:type IV secretory pathway TrbL component